MASKGTAKRDALRANEIKVQAEWEAAKVFESDAADPNQEKFIVTFPFPYSNGHLHIGHAFSLTKSVFRAQFERHMGKNVLFPFAFHCTGMPIQAVRNIYMSWNYSYVIHRLEKETDSTHTTCEHTIALYLCIIIYFS